MKRFCKEQIQTTHFDNLRLSFLRTIGVYGQTALQRREIGIVQPLLVGLGYLDLLPMLVRIHHHGSPFIAVLQGLPPL